MSEKVLNLEKERDVMKNEIVYQQSQGMRNNSMITNIPEAQGGISESQLETDSKLREFLETKMKTANERVHRNRIKKRKYK